jgi:hypothetical protein
MRYVVHRVASFVVCVVIKSIAPGLLCLHVATVELYQGMDVCIVCVYSVLVLFRVQVEALRRADPPSEESYRLCIGSRI